MSLLQVVIAVVYFFLCVFAPLLARDKNSYLIGFGVGNVGILCVAIHQALEVAK